MRRRWFQHWWVVFAGVLGALLAAQAGMAIAQAAAPSSGSGLTLTVLARQVAAGEPFRVVVSSQQALEALKGSFRGHDVVMDRVRDRAGKQTWVGWAIVGLLEEQGEEQLLVTGTTAAGEPVSVQMTVQVGEKKFREEHLEVAPKYVEPSRKVMERIKREKTRLAQIYALRTPQQFPAEPFLRPVPGKKTSLFGTRRYFNGKARAPHSGLDLRAATGGQVLASGPGEVVMVAELYYSGNLVIIDHGGGLFTLYAHLSSFEVGEGERLEAGQVIGRSGATGRVTGPHLHWGAKIGSRPFDPRSLLDPVLFGKP